MRKQFEPNTSIPNAIVRSTADGLETIASAASLKLALSNSPALWLWSHDRWSRTKEEFDHRFYVKDGKVYEKVTEEEYAKEKGWRSYWKH